MKKTQDDIEKVSRAREAEQLLGDPTFRNAMDALRNHYDTAWKNSRPSQDSEREECYRMLKLCDQLEKHLTHVVTTGTLLTLRAEQEADGDKRLRKLERETAPETM